MTPEQLQKLRELASKATPGPWYPANGKGAASVRSAECAIYINVRRFDAEYIDETVERWQHDADYIAAASPDVVLALLNRVADLEMGRDDKRDELDYENQELTDRCNALRAALNEACDMAATRTGEPGVSLNRIAALREVGQP